MTIKNLYFSKPFFRKFSKKFIRRNFLENQNLAEARFLKPKESADPLIIYIVKEKQNFKGAVSICCQIALKYPSFKHRLFINNVTSNDLFIRLPNNIEVENLNKKYSKSFLSDLVNSNPRVIVLVDQNGWTELFLECKKLQFKVFWVNAKKKKNSSFLSKFFMYSRFFSKTSKSLRGTVFVCPSDTETKETLLWLNEGYQISKNMGSLTVEPITLTPSGSSQIEKYFLNDDPIIWFGAGIYEHEIDTLIQCQNALSEVIPNIYLLLLVRKSSKNKTIVNEKLKRLKIKPYQSSKNNILLIDWEKNDIISGLSHSRVTVLGGSLSQRRHGIEIFDPILPISYSSSVIVGPNTGDYSELIEELVKGNAVHIVSKTKGEDQIHHGDLLKVIFESLKSNVLANTIRNAWVLTTKYSTLSDEFIKDFKTILDE